MKYTFLLYSDQSGATEPTPEEMEQELGRVSHMFGEARGRLVG